VGLEKINKAAYEVFSSMDEEELKLVLSALAYDTLPSYIEEQSPYIQKSVDTWLSKRFTAYEGYLKRQYLERVQKNQDVDDLEEAYEAISKADPYDPTRTPRGGDPINRGRFSRSWGPGANQANISAPYDQSSLNRMTVNFTRPLTSKPIRNPEQAGLPKGLKTSNQNDYRRMASLQAAYMQLKNQLEEYDRAGVGGDVKIQLVGNKGTQVISGTDIDEAFVGMAGAGNKVPSKAIISLPYATVGGAYFDALSAIPGARDRSDLVLNAMGGVNQLPGNISADSDFQSQWFDADYALSDNEPRFRRLKAGADLVDTFVPASAVKTKAALAGAKYVGELGPDAEKIVGPTARKLTYRSRGTERKVIDPALSSIDASDRQRAIVGYTQPVIRRGEARISGAPGTLVSYFQDRLPKKDYWELQRKSGAIPPSEGVIIDSTGKIVSQSVGFKDDHFLPFSLKGLSKLRGGEYVRTRSTGGPTTEDVYTALISGANAFTVVSRSGSFTVEFDPTFTGRRRYNDKAGKMVERYGKLLDAAGSGEVTLNQIDSARYQEIVEQARREAPTDPRAFEARKNALLEREKVMPTPAVGDEAEIKREIRAELRDEIANGGTSFAQEYAESRANNAKSIAANRRLAEQFNMPFNQPDPAILEGQLAQMVDDEVARRYPQAAKKAMEERSYKAMQLDGQGYHAALQSLKEQYPYYIANVRFIPAGSERDKGYVKPKFLRPDDVWEGYFDPSIKGNSSAKGGRLIDAKMVRHAGTHGKVQASGTNYQNARNFVPGADRDRDDVKVETKVGQAAPAPEQKVGGSFKRLRIDASDQAIIDAYRAARTIKNVDGAKISIADKTVKESFPAFASAQVELDNLQGSMLPILRDPQRRQALITDLNGIRGVIEGDPAWQNAPEYTPFMNAVRNIGRSENTAPLSGGNEAILSPNKAFSFPEIDAIDDTAQYNDRAQSVLPTWNEILGVDGKDDDSKITNYIILQQQLMDDEEAKDEPSSVLIEDYKKKAVQAHIIRAMIAKGEELKRIGKPINIWWATGGPNSADTTIHTRAIQ
jgi:hypothetical protein